ncbi:hypothetical protein P3S67_030696 [Capsicum chacoense]
MSNPIGGRLSEGGASNENISISSPNEVESVVVAEPSKKRKAMEPRAKCWQWFDKFVDKETNQKAKCKYCGKIYAVPSSISGTSSMNNHMQKLCPYRVNVGVKDTQTKLGFQPSSATQMIVVDELPFSFVEEEGFKNFMRVTVPHFHIPSRRTLTRDCYQFHNEEKQVLKKVFKEVRSKVCLTTDTWTSIQKINYMCLTSHFIDTNWKLHKKVINFCPISSHKGVDMASSITNSLLEWGLNTVFSITVDNARRFYKGGLEKCEDNDKIFENLYDLTLKVFGSKYITNSVHLVEIAELDMILKEMIENEDFHLKKMATNMRKKFRKYWGDPEKMNKMIFISFVLDPCNKLEYVPFAIVNMFGKEIREKLSDSVEAYMKALFEHYVKKSKNFSSTSHSENSSSVSSYGNFQRREIMRTKQQFEKHKEISGGSSSKFELKKYLAEEIEPDSEKFVILGWWKVNEPRFPILAEMARDVLAISISSVASECAFNTGGRVIDPFRSSLNPKLVQSLICLQYWLRLEPIPINAEEDLEYLEQLEIEMTCSGAESSIVDV